MLKFKKQYHIINTKDEIFEYFDKYVEFEELIFASDSFYRDHTMHCLWVYFLGKYIKGEAKFDFSTSKMDEEYQRLDMILEEIKKVEGTIDFKNVLNIMEQYKNTKINNYNEFIFDYTDIQGKLIEEFTQFMGGIFNDNILFN